MLTADLLNCYILPGRIADARIGLAQARDAEAIGLGGVFLSERWESKEIASVMGALSQATSRVKLVAGITHFGTRHPLVHAGMAATIQTLSEGRFVLGYGRGVPANFRRLGIPVLGIAAMADFVGLLRRLWAGETVSYSGPAGDYPAMKLARPCETPPPVILGAIGPKTLAMAGAHFDGVILHPFLTTEGVARSATLVREAAARAGRDPAAVTVYATVVTALDTLTLEQRGDLLEARAVSYFMLKDVGPALAAANGWDLAPIQRLIESGLHERDFARGGAETRRLMAEAGTDLPPAWMHTGAAVGQVANCIDRFGAYLKAGADRILLHGARLQDQAAIAAALPASDARG